MSCGYCLLTWHLDFSLFIFHLTACSHKTNVPADLQSAGIEYKDFNPIISYFYFRYELPVQPI